MRSWDDFLPEVLPDVPGCPDAKAVNAIRYAARELCRKSEIWRADLANKLALVAGEPLIDIDPDSAEESIVTASHLGYYAAGVMNPADVPGPYSEDELDIKRPGWRYEASTGTVNSMICFLMPTGGKQIRVVPIPVVNQADALVATVVLQPASASTAAPDFLHDDWLEVIGHGALWRLMVEPGRKWSNEVQAGYHKSMFDEGMNNASAKALKGGGKRSVTVYPRRFC